MEFQPIQKFTHPFFTSSSKKKRKKSKKSNIKSVLSMARPVKGKDSKEQELQKDLNFGKTGDNVYPLSIHLLNNYFHTNSSI